MIKHVLSALALVLAPVTVPTAASAQYYSGIKCEARSNYAIGVGIAPDRNSACNRALIECSVRTPGYDTCYVTRWWFI